MEERRYHVRSELDERVDFYRCWARLDRGRITIRDPHGEPHPEFRHSDTVACKAARRQQTLRAIAAARGGRR